MLGSKMSTKRKSKVIAPRNPKLVKGNNFAEKDTKQCPSAYLSEMLLTTQERLNKTYVMRIPEITELLDMSETSHQKATSVDIEEPLFQPFPSEIVFQNFEAQQTYSIPLQLRNNDKVARLVKVIQVDSPYFKIVSPPDVGQKVAPGMESVFMIQFVPVQKKDYNHEVTCITEREKFLVPVKAIGRRGILDFPDEINFSVCPVKYASTKILLVRNIGNDVAHFQLYTERPFNVTPDRGVLEIGKNMQIEISFCAQQTGSHSSHLIIQYETGEEIHVGLYGDAVDINIRLDKNSIKMDNTYIGNTSRRFVSIFNRSDIVVNFRWKSFATSIGEDQHRKLCYQQEHGERKAKRDAFLEECITDPLTRNQFALLTRSFKNEIKKVYGDPVLYNDENLIVEPAEGEIWPNSSVDISIVFKPGEESDYVRTAYLDVIGREMRLPLKLRGEGIGPKVQFSFDTLDVENIFVNSHHAYEVILKNIGDIDAVFSYIPSQTLFGQQFTFTPTDGLLKVGEYQAIQIVFSSPHLGKFIENFQWSLEGSSRVFKFNVRGNIIGPTFHFNTKQLKFGTISYGFTYDKTFKIVNTSLIPMAYRLHVSTDGTNGLAAEIASKFLEGVTPVANDPKAAEFEINPKSGVILPTSELEVQVRLTSLTSGRYETLICVDVEGVGEQILALPVSAKSIVPNIELSTDTLDFCRCSIQHKYEKNVSLLNDSELPAKYELIPQVHGEEAGIFYESPLPRGIIEANSTLDVPFHVIVTRIGPVKCLGQFSIFGSTQRSLMFNLLAIGEGPVVHVGVECIQFNIIPVLVDSSQTITLANQSLIPAHFHCHMMRDNSHFKVEPVSAVISPEASLQLKVTANVNDTLRFQDKLQILVENSQILALNLSAQGAGTTIVTEPSFGPKFDLGAQLSSRIFQQKFRFVNKGRRPQQICWMTDGFVVNKMKRKQNYNQDDMKFKNLPPPPVPAKPVFQLIPDRLSLAPGQSHDVLFKAFTDDPRLVKERMVCQAIIGNNFVKEKIIVVDVQANFIQPLLEFSDRNLNFTVVMHPGCEPVKEVKMVTLQNISLLPLHFTVKLNYPFSMLKDGTETTEMDMLVDINSSIDLLIQFDPDFENNKYIRRAESKLEVIYLDHPSTDEMWLSGDVYYPNLKFETETVHFSSVLNDTEHLQSVKVTNTSPLDVFYTWSFVHHDICFEEKDQIDEGLGKELTDSSDEEKFSSAELNKNISDQLSLLLPSLQMPNTPPASSDPVISECPPTAPTECPPTAPIECPPTAPIECAPTATKKNEQVAVTLSDIKATALSVGIEEVFDVLPLYGSLRPTECQQFQFTFYGHSHIMAEATAVCSVKGGPDYEVQLKGEASVMNYKFSKREIDFGKQLYDEVNCTQIELINTGKVDFDFVVLNVDTSDTVYPCAVNVTPDHGFVAGGDRILLTVRYIAGMPERYKRDFQIRVGHFEPEDLSITGEGVFQRITLNLPNDTGLPKHQQLYEQAEKNLKIDRNTGDVLESDIYEEMDRIQVKEHSLSMLEAGSSFPLRKKQKLKISLIDYVLDFGHVIINTLASQTCELTNAGCFDVSLMTEKKHLINTGFYVDLDRVKGLPGALESERVEFQVAFNPTTPSVSLGPIETVLPIKIERGPCINVLLKAYVTMPELSVSPEQIEFNDVICGQCKVITVQLYNSTRVRCDWNHQLPEEITTSDKTIPMHIRKKMKGRKPKPRTFEIMPPSSCLQPGQKINIQIKFMPTEETVYQEQLLIKVSQSSQNLFISCGGKGLEPHIDFENSVLQFGPILPHTGNDDVSVKLTNPSSFPIEFYSLEFDKQYLEEEKVLRTLSGYDEQNTMLLPPRAPGSLLPKQLLDHYEAAGGDQPANSNFSAANIIIGDETDVPEEKGLCVGDLEITPVSAAIAMYLGIDLSVEGRAARNRRGICIIVHGAPLSGKTATSIELAMKYGTALVTIDEVVEQAIQYGSSSAAQRTRELCSAAAGIAKANTAILAQTNNDTKPDDVAPANTGLRALPSQGQGPRKPSVLTSGAKGRQQNQQVPAVSSPQNNDTKPDDGAPASTGLRALPSQGQGPRKPSVLASAAKGRQQSQQVPVVSPVQNLVAPAFVSKKIDVTCMVNDGDNGDEEYYTCELPDDVFVELLSDRLQASDCHQGVVVDGLESMFSSSISSTATILLRAINNRKYIYSLTLKFDVETLKDMNLKNEQEKEKQRVLAEEAEWKKLHDMSEGEYDALTEEERVAIDQKRLEAKKERLRKKREKEEEERERKEKELLEEKKLGDEKGSRKGRKSTALGVGKIKEKKSADKLSSIRENAGQKLNPPTDSNVARPDTAVIEHSVSIDDAEKKQRGGVSKNSRQKSGLLKVRQITPIIENQDVEESEESKHLKARFAPFQLSTRDIYIVFDTWDRTAGNIISPDSEKELEIEIPRSVSASVSKKSDRKKAQKEKLNEISESPGSNEQIENLAAYENERSKDGVGIPNIILETKEPQKSLFPEAMLSGVLPTLEEVLDGIGTGPSGPPVPPEALFSVIPYPIEREGVQLPDCGQHYIFIASSESDPNAIREDRSKSDVSEVEKIVTEKKDSKKKKYDRSPSAKQKGRQSTMTSNKSDSPPLLQASPEKESVMDGGSKSSLELYKHRWVIPAGESVELRISFMSEHLGQFDQTLNFEIVGTRRRYQLFCRGVCAFPGISREPRIVFPNRRKYKNPGEIFPKKFILSSETFEFGPLLAGKNRERYREGRYPENMERICICNSSPMHSEISFSYLNDSNATTFLVEPSTMSLPPGTRQKLRIWAYPKTPGHYEDTLVCCIKENPEPVLFKFSVDGVRPELELDRKSVQFERVLLHRKETRTVYLRNSTLLPVAWKLNGLENLGDDFSVTVDHGVIEPLHEFAMQLHFRAIKPATIKKIVRLEVSDADNMMGLAHAENLTVQAEAYDVALDMSFPKGADGGLDFGVIRVGEEVKQICTLRNKGKYEISYNFLFEPTGESLKRVEELFTITPCKGTLNQNDRPTQVQVMFKSKGEIEIKDVPILRCQIVEPSMGEGGETIATIPIRINARSLYSKYTIYPVHDINFGAVLINTKKSRTLEIENTGDFEFRFSIAKTANLQTKLKGTNNNLVPSSSRQGSLYSNRSQQIQPQRSKRDSLKGVDALGAGNATNVGPGHNNVRLNLGMFTIFPANGVVLPGLSAVVTVDMISEIAIVCEEEFVIDISERSPKDNPSGIEHRIFGEVCIPNIISLPRGVQTIFEEQRIVKNLNVFRYHSHDLSPGSGVYGEDENKFIFYNVIVGHKAKARFQISNTNKVPCDISINVKPISNKLAHKITDIYEVEPQRTSIPAHSSAFATVIFQPSSMQAYSCIFEALVEGLSASMAKGRSLSFEIYGDGNLPRVSVTKPTTTNKKGCPIMVFHRLLVGRSQLLPVVLQNDGTLPCKMEVALIDPNQSFIVHQKETNVDSNKQDHETGKLFTTSSRPVSKTFQVPIDSSIHFLVEFAPKLSIKMAAELRFSVVNNPFEDNVIQLIGEGYKQCVTIDNIHSSDDALVKTDCGMLFEGDEVMVPSSNQLNFGDCMIDIPKSLTFTLTNHSTKDTLRYCWNSMPQLKFSPSCGHMPPNCARDITITYHSPKPHAYERGIIPCKVETIILTQSNKKKAQSWDDNKRVIQWVDDLSISPSLSDVENVNSPGTTMTGRIGSKKKVIQVETEPSHTVLSGSAISLDLVVSSNCNYANYTCSTDRIYFKDTFMFETRIYSFSLKNEGDVKLNYSWCIQPGKYDPPEPDDEETKSREIKSGKNARKATGIGSKPVMSRQSGTKSRQDPPTSNNRKTPIASARSRKSSGRESIMADLIDGRPASAMTLAHEASGSVDAYARGTDDLPYTIEPQQGSIAAGEEGTFTVRFSPLEIDTFDAILFCHIENLPPHNDKRMIALQGTSTLPWCHFELIDSDYIKERRNPDLRGPNGTAAGVPLEMNTKVVELHCCGLYTTVRKSFFILNPTNTEYTFHWIQESIDGTTSGVNANMTCATTRGSINPGKKIEIVFEYNVETLELAETFWRFSIDNHNMSVPFLVVVHGSEPNISLDRSHVNFKELLLSYTAKEMVNIVNDEDNSFNFAIDEFSRHAAGHVACLQINPMKGILAPKSKFPIAITYKPEIETEVNFNVVCRVKQKTTPLTVNVKARGFKVNMDVICEDSAGQKIVLTQTGNNIISFGNVEVNGKSVRQIFISNTGNFGVDFKWQLNGPSKPKNNKKAWDDNPPVVITPEMGTVAPDGKKRCQLSFCPPCKLTLKKCNMLLKVLNGPTYNITVAGCGVIPAVDFSFTCHDFGACFIYRVGLPIQKKILRITNNDTRDVSIEMLYSNTKHLEVMSVPSVIPPGGSKEVEFRFYPRETRSYCEKVEFELNGLSAANVMIYGQGTEMKVEVANAVDRKVNLGALLVNEKGKRNVRIVNNSLAAIEFNLIVTPFTLALQSNSVLSVAPGNTIHLKQKACCDVIVRFHPRTRIPKFSEEVMLECCGVSQPLFTIVGACHGLEVKLDSEALPFGSVTLGSTSTRKLIMTNNGDIGTSFSWNIDAFRPTFNIIPHKGYISPGMVVAFEITFQPIEVSQDIRHDDLRCTLENHLPLKLVLTGSCIPQMPMKDVINFSTVVRSRDTKSIILHNKTNQQWILRPVIDGEFWSGADPFVVEALQSRSYEIVYRPVTMTKENVKHNGSVFFALPDGSGLLYNLVGAADAPKPVGIIQRDIPCKMNYTELLIVTNWLRRPQRFRVITELLKPERPDPATSFKGLEYVDVSGLAKKEYKVNFYAHREGTFSSKITFKNDETGEFQYYYVGIKVGSPGTIGAIELSTPVRQSISHVVTISNPLATMANFQTNCNIQDVNLPPQLSVPAFSEGSCTFEYLPLKVGPANGKLTLQSFDLGMYIYDLNLVATSPAPERAVHFVTTLGTSQSQGCKFMNYARTRAEYVSKVVSTEFSVERSVNAASAANGGSEVGVDVTFEPSRLGESQATLLVSSIVGGEYIFPIFGHCLPPKPQGPYTIKAGGSTQIQFKNIFSQATAFTFHVDNPVFTVKAAGDTIRAKKTHNILISFDGNQGDSKTVRMGRLLVTCARSAGCNNNLVWTFYLKGVTA